LMTLGHILFAFHLLVFVFRTRSTEVGSPERITDGRY